MTTLPHNGVLLYFNTAKPHHQMGLEAFKKLMAEFPGDYVNPNPRQAPWHIQAKIDGALVNFWPCANKAQVEGEYGIYGYEKIRERLLNLAEEEDFNPIEDW